MIRFIEKFPHNVFWNGTGELFWRMDSDTQIFEMDWKRSDRQVLIPDKKHGHWLIFSFCCAGRKVAV